MRSRFAVLSVIFGAALGLVACGGSDESATTTESAAAESPSKSSAVEHRIEKIEQETKEAELEAAVAKREAAQQAAKAAAKRAAAAEAEAEEQAPVAEEESSSEPPNVIGMRLPEAESTLRAAGFKTQAENTDTTFGIVVRSHYTICTQSEPHGDVVTVLAQKYGC
jgi:alpha-acetolactate decarboxylase